MNRLNKTAEVAGAEADGIPVVYAPNEEGRSERRVQIEGKKELRK